jgi:hypothetical protein
VICQAGFVFRHGRTATLRGALAVQGWAYHSCGKVANQTGVKADTLNGSANTPIQVSGMNKLSALLALTDIPRYFCWTRFGTEAGQTTAQIIERKERERIAG